MISFKFLEQYLNNTNINLVITKNGEEITVSLLPKPKINDEAKSVLKPIIIKGTATELDEQFHVILQKPLEKASGVTSNILSFEASVKEMEQKSEAQKKIKEEQEKNKKKADSELEKVDELIKNKDFNKALICIKKSLEIYPEYKKAIELEKQVSEAKTKEQPDIFAQVTEESPKEEIKETKTPILEKEEIEELYKDDEDEFDSEMVPNDEFDLDDRF